MTRGHLRYDLADMRALTALALTAALSAQTAGKHTFEVSVIGPALKGENGRARIVINWERAGGVEAESVFGS